ncbi:PH domain-containing protein [Lentibacillus sediminis]|uniref:PH domain-containing protein n=1 Tax=Lentibacillus sediminis TaxID=1940529 RepID=UPI000C1BAF05|nr:PH domain-containing protein [Lentibacillus sediminis]
MYFRSRKDTWLTILIWGIALFGVAVPIAGGNIFGMLFILPLSLVLLWFWFQTGYKIEGDLIRIKYGPIRMKVEIQKIIQIRKHRSIFAAPALSIHRLEINSGRFNIISISPENEKEFINEILKINPELEMERIRR